MDRRIIVSMVFLGALGGCVAPDSSPETGGVKPHYGKSFGPPSVPGVEGPYGTKVPMAAPYAQAFPTGMSDEQARAMMSANQSMGRVQMNPMGGPMPGGPPGAMMPPSMAPGGFVLSPPGMPAMPGMSPGGPGMMPGGPGGMMPPPPGMMPGGPGGMMPPPPGMMPPSGNPMQRTSFMNTGADPALMNADMRGGATGGVMNAYDPNGAMNGLAAAQFAPGGPGGPGGGVMPAQFANSSPVGSMFPAQRTQVYFGSPVRMKIYWFTQGADGKPNYSTTPLETPGRYNFAQGAIYRLKLTNIPGRPALELYPTLEVVPTSPRTNEFLAHNSVPIDFTEEDFKQVVDRNYIVKVIYLPDPQNQDGAGAGPGEISSTQLQPGQDPIQEALRLGSILLVLRIGNIDQGLQHTPPMTQPGPFAPPGLMKPPGMGVMPFPQVPYNAVPITPGPPPGFGPAPHNLPPLNVDPKVDVKDAREKKVDAPPLPLPPPNLKGEEIKLPGVGALPLPPAGGGPLPPPGAGPVNLPPPNIEVVPSPTAKPSSEKPFVPSIPTPEPKESSKAPAKTNLPVVPASSGSEPSIPSVTLPGLPAMVDPLNPPLPAIPMVPSQK